VFASFLLYQFLETSLAFGATIQNVPDAIHIRFPPCMEVPNDGFTNDTVVHDVADVAKEFIAQTQ
jgi:hypothetical protein